MGYLCCCGNNDEWKTETYIQKYEDDHVKVEAEHILEKCKGRTKNETKNVSIYNKDNFYKVTDLLAPGNNLLLGK